MEASTHKQPKNIGNRRDRVYERDQGICQLCGGFVPRDEATMDRVVPRARGGRYTVDNMWTTHRDCNFAKGDRDVPRFVFAPPGYEPPGGLQEPFREAMALLRLS